MYLIIISTTDKSPVHLLRFTQEDRPEDLKAAIVADFKVEGISHCFARPAATLQ